VLVDTSVWIDHFRRGNARLEAILHAGEVRTHPFVVGELACGNLVKRDEVLQLLRSLPEVVAATNDEVLEFVERNRLMGAGIGWIDAHLLASTVLTPTSLWSLDAKLARQARRLNLAIRD
jgi:predicted nucleic acid-binding protein